MQVADLFPIPIEIFKPDGAAAFVNQTWLEIHNISSPADIVGIYNIRSNHVVNEELGLYTHVRSLFEGETVLSPESKAPLKDFAEWCHVRSPENPIEAMYMEVLGFPVLTPGGNASHFIGVFVPTRIYRGNLDIARAREYMDNNWTEEFDTGKVANAVNLSQAHFARLFKKQTGMTPYNYYQNLKVKKLKEALRNKNLTIGEAFRECGVEYSGNYARIFKELVGTTPSEYRSSLK